MILIGDHNLQIGIILGQQCFDCGGQFFRFIARGKNNGSRRRAMGTDWGNVGKPRQAGHANARPDTLNNP